jgi:tetratricopeptide (TPR) repeat protein
MQVAPVEAQALPTGQHAAEVEEQIELSFREAMQAIYRGRPSEAGRIADELIELAPSDPRTYMLKARVLRLDVADQNFERSDIKPEMKPIKELCDQAVAASNTILERDPESLAGHLYRGWALMFKSQMHALANEYWSAGRRAKAGKEDLDFVLQRQPTNPDALLIQGTFLYFADILPGVVKVARVLVRLPGGNGDLGLEYMNAATERQGLSHLDARPLIGVVYFGFEGRFEDGIAEFEKVLEDYPTNPRILEPLAVMNLFFPARLDAELRRTERGVQAHANGPEAWERKVSQRLRFYLALQQMLAGRIEDARQHLEILQQEETLEPDWLGFEVRWTLANVLLLLGERDAAVALVEELPPRQRESRRLSYVRDRSSVASDEESAALVEIQPAVRALYAGDLAAAAAGLEAVGDVDMPILHFYRGELALLNDAPEEALQHYARANHVQTGRDRWAWFRYFAKARSAEIHGAAGDLRKAAKLLDSATDKHLHKDLVRHVTQARQRYYENGRPGHVGEHVDSKSASEHTRAQSQ